MAARDQPDDLAAPAGAPLADYVVSLLPLMWPLPVASRLLSKKSVINIKPEVNGAAGVCLLLSRYQISAIEPLPAVFLSKFF